MTPQVKLITTVALSAALAGLAACGQKPAETQSAEASSAEPAPGAVPPNLWRVEVLNDGAVVDTLDICADHDVQAGFARPAPELNGQACNKVGDTVETADTYSVRCRIDDKLYRVGSSTKGDTTKDFTVDMAVTRQDEKGPSFEQTRHYTLQGACPAGWRVGDSGKPGAATVTDSVTGEQRELQPATGD